MRLLVVASASILALVTGRIEPLSAQTAREWRAVQEGDQSAAVQACMRMSVWGFEPSWSGDSWSAFARRDRIVWPSPAGVVLPEGWSMTSAAVPVRAGLLLPLVNVRQERSSVAHLRDSSRNLNVIDDAPAHNLIGLGGAPYTKALGTGQTVDPAYLRIDPELRLHPLYIYGLATDGTWAVIARRGMPEQVRAAVAGSGGVLAWVVTDSALWRVTDDFAVVREMALAHEVLGRAQAVLSPTKDKLVVGMPVYALEIDLRGARATGQRWWLSRACERVRRAALGCDCAGLPDELVELSDK